MKADVEPGEPGVAAIELPVVEPSWIASFLPVAVEAEKECTTRAVAEFGRPSSADPRYFICYARVARSIARDCGPLEFKARHRSRLSPG